MFHKVQTTAAAHLYNLPVERTIVFSHSFQSSENDTHILSCLGTHAFVWCHSVDCIFLYILRERFVDPCFKFIKNFDPFIETANLSGLYLTFPRVEVACSIEHIDYEYKF